MGIIISEDRKKAIKDFRRQNSVQVTAKRFGLTARTISKITGKKIKKSLKGKILDDVKRGYFDTNKVDWFI
jgi:hypothetical protein